MIHIITYADKHFERAKYRLCQEAENTGWFDSIQGYSPNDLTEDFINKYKKILEMPRGNGYWIWKYDIIRQKLNEIKNEDILIYLDAGCSINSQGEKQFYEYINMLNDTQPIISFQMKLEEKQWTTSHIFDYFNVSNNKNITDTGQIVGGILIMKKNNALTKILDIWGKTLEDNPLLFTDNYNMENQQFYFRDNRHEQSVFSVIRKMNNPILIDDTTWFKPFGTPESLNYPFWATRKKN